MSPAYRSAPHLDYLPPTHPNFQLSNSRNLPTYSSRPANFLPLASTQKTKTPTPPPPATKRHNHPNPTNQTPKSYLAALADLADRPPFPRLLSQALSSRVPNRCRSLPTRPMAAQKIPSP